MTSSRQPIALPSNPHVPGQNARPAEDCFDVATSAVSPGLPPLALAASDAFQGGLEALSRGYHWEAHELLEAVWACLPPASAERHLLRGLIQLANAGLKRRMGRPAAVARILPRAESSLTEAFLQGQKRVMGLGAEDLARYRCQIDRERPQQV